jgi:AbiV family abortive infection protein
MDTSEDGRSAISGSLENARELLSAARALLDAGQPARLAYHFAALVLEEVGNPVDSDVTMDHIIP